MSEFKVLDDLENLLKAQLGLFSQVAEVQAKILDTLGDEIDFSNIMGLLNRKEELVLKISENSQNHQPFISDYMQRKVEFADHPQSQLIESLLIQIETQVSAIQTQDEKMVEFFQSKPTSHADQDPQNILNAYRGLR